MKQKKSIPKGKRSAQRTYTVDLGGIPVTVTRKPMKSLRLRVLSSDLSVRLSIPAGVSEERVMLFLLSRETWIRDTLARLSARPIRDADRWDTLVLWGTPYPLRISEDSRRYSLSLSEGEAIYRVPAGSTEEKRREHLKELLKNELIACLAELFPRWEEITGLHPVSRDVRDMKSRWGSCNRKTGHIRMNLRLVHYPRICTEYVILHELCHLRVANHGAEFKALLDAYMPEWRQIRKILNDK